MASRCELCSAKLSFDFYAPFTGTRFERLKSLDQPPLGLSEPAARNWHVWQAETARIQAKGQRRARKIAEGLGVSDKTAARPPR